MKELRQYLKESLAMNSPSFISSTRLNGEILSEDRDQTIRLNDFEASWQVKDPENHGGSVVIELPNDYEDDEVQQYLSDLMLESMPTDEDLAKEYFGTNADHIIDARFEYEKKEDARDGLHVTFNFDKSLDDQYKGNENLKKYALANLRLIVDWEYFDVTNTSDDGLMYDLWDIFKRTKSSKNVIYMDGKINLDISEKDLVFDNGKSELMK